MKYRDDGIDNKFKWRRYLGKDSESPSQTLIKYLKFRFMTYEDIFRQYYSGGRGSLSPIKCSINIQSSHLKVWNKILDKTSWGHWWGNLKSVKPNWKLGAILEWEHGSESKITAFQNHREIAIAGPSIKITITLTSLGNETEMSLEEQPINGAKWTDNGMSRFAPVNAGLIRFKNLIEAE